MPRTVSVVRIGTYEIRMFNVFPNRSGDVPLLWMDLFDHHTQTSVDSCNCHEIDDAVSALDKLISQVKRSGRTGS